MNRKRLCGLIGFPLAGKKSLYKVLAKECENILEKDQKEILNLPVFDKRLDMLSQFCKNSKKHPVSIDFLNCFSGNQEHESLCQKTSDSMRKVTVLVHVMRCFGNKAPSPTEEIDKMHSHIVTSDLDLVQKRLTKLNCARKFQEVDVMSLEKMAQWLGDGKSARQLPREDPLRNNIKILELQLLSMKPVLYVLNTDNNDFGRENKFEKEVNDSFAEEIIERAPVISVCIDAEEEFYNRKSSQESRVMSNFYKNLTQIAYSAMQYQTFFTTGDTMTHAWSIYRGSNALEASSQIHSKFGTRFRSARVLQWDDYITHKSIQSAEAAMVLQNSEYVMKDGDVLIVDLEKG